MAGGYSLWSSGIFVPIWYVWTKKNLATLICLNTLVVHILTFKLISSNEGI
jgi:hypothetical protein